MRHLHVTNGDAAGERIRTSGVEGVVLPWRDVLHEGPVPALPSLEETSRVRARFIAGCGWGELAQVDADFRDRDQALCAFRGYAKTTLWFEHDLYDQLQLIQLLHWFSGRELNGAELGLICIGEHPGVEPFHGLGQLTPSQTAALLPTSQPVSAEQLRIGCRAWEAFVSDDPGDLEDLAGRDLEALPFLAPALRRLLEFYPATGDGLSRSERQLLEALADGESELPRLFQVSQSDREESPFMGDSTFLLLVRSLAAGRRALVRFARGPEPGATSRGLTRPASRS